MSVEQNSHNIVKVKLRQNRHGRSEADKATEHYSKIINKICHNEAGGATMNNVVGDECIAFVKVML